MTSFGFDTGIGIGSQLTLWSPPPLIPSSQLPAPSKLPPQTPMRHHRHSQVNGMLGRRLTFDDSNQPSASKVLNASKTLFPRDALDGMPLDREKFAFSSLKRRAEQEEDRRTRLCLDLPRPSSMGFGTYGVVDGSHRMPPTPVKTSGKKLEGFADAVNAVLKKIAIGEELKFSGIPFHIGEAVGSGTYSNVYRISSDLPLVESYSNDQVLFKCYQQDYLKVGNRVNSYFKNVKEQYQALVAANFPAAKILNMDTAKTDGYFLVENIPHEFEGNWSAETPVSSLSEKTMKELNQVKAMFQKGLELNIALDLSPSNVRVKEDGTLVLIDFREEEEEVFGTDNVFGIVMPGLLRGFAQGNEEIYHFLNPINKS